MPAMVAALDFSHYGEAEIVLAGSKDDAASRPWRRRRVGGTAPCRAAACGWRGRPGFPCR